MVNTTSLVSLFVICQQISNLKVLTRVQLNQLNKSGMGKAILARWHVQNESFSIAAQKFLDAYEETGKCSMLFEAAYSLLMWAKKLYKDEFGLISYGTKQTVRKNERKAVSLLIDAANRGHLQAAACVLCMYITSEWQVQINRKILFLALDAANAGFLDGRVVPQPFLFFCLVPRSDELQMINSDTFVEICHVIYRMSFDQLIELTDSEMKILTKSFTENLLFSQQSVSQKEGNKIRTKLVKLFSY